MNEGGKFILHEFSFAGLRQKCVKWRVRERKRERGIETGGNNNDQLKNTQETIELCELELKTHKNIFHLYTAQKHTENFSRKLRSSIFHLGSQILVFNTLEFPTNG
jgi:hypothetical protein